MVRNLMDKVGVDFFADIHGDEELPYNFISGSEGIPKWSPRLEGGCPRQTLSTAFWHLNTAYGLLCQLDAVLCTWLLSEACWLRC